MRYANEARRRGEVTEWTRATGHADRHRSPESPSRWIVAKATVGSPLEGNQSSSPASARSRTPRDRPRHRAWDDPRGSSLRRRS